MSTPALRPIEETEYLAWIQTLDTAFGVVSDKETVQAWRARVEMDRSLAAVEDGEIVATAALRSFRITVPGADVPCAGVTAVGVLPTHRRQGLLRALMRRQLEELHASGESLAVLWASESEIYGRYGYGIATWHARMSLTTDRSAFAPPHEPAGRVRLVSADAAGQRFPRIYDRARGRRAGMVAWGDGDWAYWIERGSDEPGEQEGARWFAVYERGRRDTGYVIYRIVQSWPNGSAGNRLHIEHLVGVDAEAELALWRYVLDIDLVTEVTASLRPVDDAVLLRLADLHGVQTHLQDGLWLRLVRVDEALAARQYTGTGTVILAVRDPMLPGNEGTWALTVADGTASCRPTRRKPQLTLEVSDLAAAYLGGTSFTRLAAAGLVTEHVRGALARADALFATPLAPWCPLDF